MTSSDIITTDEAFMAKALDLAEKALGQGEFPVGCVIANTKAVVARGYRLGTSSGAGNEIDHAEMNALRELSSNRDVSERSELTVYSTLEPCLMCYSAILLSGITRIVYAYEDVMGGGTNLDRSGLPSLYREARLSVVSGVLRKESLLLFKRFFSDPNTVYWTHSPLSRHALSQHG